METEISPSAPASFTPPEYTMKEIYDAIPPHCFESHTLLSLAYVLRDYVFVFILMVGATQVPSIENCHLRLLAWMTYSLCQGLVFTGLWEIAHECGHGALSKYKWVNNVIGIVVHSFLLVPYHSWRFTHSQHHRSTNNLERDIAFVPNIKEDYIAERSTHHKTWALIEDMPIVCLAVLFIHQLIAFPLYLIINNLALPRMRAAAWWKNSHFYFGGDGPNFKPVNRNDIIVSDLGIAVALTILWQCAIHFGIWNVAWFYIFPYLWTNHWIRKF
jgi:omega-6 fatty acid desaturase (delta-12 desaturase)